MIRERENTALPGLPVAIGLITAAIVSAYSLFQAARADAPGTAAMWGGVLLLAVFFMTGLFVVNPNEGKVLQFFGRYVGTVKEAGLRWANPFYTKKRISLRVRNFESAHLKVNDNEGNPIEIAAVVVWRVVDTAEAVFEVDDYKNYVHVQTEAALRNLATSYPYDAHDEAQMSLRGHTAAVAEHLKKEIQDRLPEGGRRGDRGADQPPRLRAGDRRRDAAAPAGRRDHRGPPAHRRGRRRHGRDGARDAVASATSSTLDEERKAAMVSNLLVVLCGERGHAAGHQHRDDLPVVTPWPSASRSCFGSTGRSSTPSSAGPTTTCAASTGRSSSCCGAR